MPLAEEGNDFAGLSNIEEEVLLAAAQTKTKTQSKSFNGRV